MGAVEIVFVAGERSGDAHGAALIECLAERRPGWRVWGYGGERMRAVGGEGIDDWVEEAGVVGLWEVLKKYGYFRQRFDALEGRVIEREPAAVVFIDYPGFNLRLAGALARRGSLAKRVYFISPQVWAWNRGRIPKMARVLDLMLCIFPFEKALYEASGLKTEFVGHPLADRLAGAADAAECEAGLIGLFPGSREREVGKLFPEMLAAVPRVAAACGGAVRFVASAASAGLARTMEGMRAEAGVDAGLVAIETGGSTVLMQRCEAGVVASGTATLEAAFCGMPYCLVYKVAPLTYAVGKMLVRVPYLGIVNVLAGREVVRELIQGEATGERIAAELVRLSSSGEVRAALQDELRAVVAGLGEGGTAARAADEIIAYLEGGEG